MRQSLMWILNLCVYGARLFSYNNQLSRVKGFLPHLCCAEGVLVFLSHSPVFALKLGIHAVLQCRDYLW